MREQITAINEIEDIREKLAAAEQSGFTSMTPLQILEQSKNELRNMKRNCSPHIQVPKTPQQFQS